MFRTRHAYIISPPPPPYLNLALFANITSLPL